MNRRREAIKRSHKALQCWLESVMFRNMAGEKLLLKKGTVFNSLTGRMNVLDVLIEGPEIKEIDSDISDSDAAVIGVEGKLVVPGLIDAHVHFRQPGQEYKEDIHSGSYAAAAGGFTAVIAEPNTNPPIDTASRLVRVLRIAKKQSIINFYSKAAVTKAMTGKKLADIGELKRAGARAISDDGNPVSGRTLMRNALVRAREHGIPVSPHCEESESYREEMLKKSGRRDIGSGREPYASEDIFVERDIELAGETGAQLHISHVSLARSVRLIAEGKKKGIKVTAEATPHHCLLTAEDGERIGTDAKVNPPLRSKEDIEAITAGLADGTIDIIASDHAPHSPSEKSMPLAEAPFGIIGLETTLGLVLTHLVRPGILSLSQAIEKMTSLPARIFGLNSGTGFPAPGGRADITIIDTEKRWKVDSEKFYSKGRNCPFNGWELQGKAVMTIVGGRIVWAEGDGVRGED